MSAFRESAKEKRSGVVRYGPFHVQISRIFGAIAFVAVGALLGFAGSAETRVSCDAAGACVVAGHDNARFDRKDLRTARVDIASGHKKSKVGYTVLVFHNGAELRLMNVDPDQAHQAVAEIQSGIAGSAPFSVVLRGSRLLLLATLLFGVVGVSLAIAPLKALRSYRLEIVDDGATLRVRRRHLGLPGKSFDLPLEHLADVKVEGGELPDFWRSRGQAPPPAGRIVLHYKNKSRRELTEDLVIGLAVHLRAASELRALLGFDALPGGVEDQLAALPPRTAAAGARWAAVWIGVTVGAVSGIGVLGATLVLLGFARMSDGIEPWMLGVGSLGGIGTGVGIALYLTRTRPPL